jgi:hypothetical protein
MMLSWLVLVLRVLIFHPLWCEVTVVRIDAVVWARFGMVEMVRIRQVMWIVMVEYAMDWILGVDTPGQQVPPRVRYGMTCWLIRKALVSLSCWMSGTGMAIPTRPQGARGAWGYSVVPNKGKPMTKQDIWSRVNLCKGMIWGIHQRKCKNGKMRFSSHWRVMKSLCVGTM